MQGKIIKGIAGFYYVYAEETDTIYECKAKGIFRNRRVKPLVGDLVAIEVLDEEQAKGNITEILPRKNELIRPASANVDQAMVIFAAFPVLMGVVLALWMGGFDIIYYTQDEMVDRELGLHSVPARFGRKVALRIALASHVAMLGAAWCLGYVFHMGLSWWIPYGLMVSALAYIHFFRASDDLDSLNRDFFLANVGISLVVFVGMVAWIATGGGLDGFMA